MFNRTRSAAVAVGLVSLLALGACAPTGGSSGGGGSSDYPSRKIEMIVSFGAGGAVDSAARLIAPVLERELGVTVEVTNVTGAGGQVGYTRLAKAKPDGYTIGTTGSPSVVVAPLDPSRGATFTMDSFQPLALQVIDPAAVAVAPDSSYQTLDDLFAAARKNPGKINASTTGLQGGEHFVVAQMGDRFGAEFNPVHFSEGQAAATTAFLGGNVEVYVGNASDMVELQRQGQARVLGVAAEERSASLPEVPTFAEQGYEFSGGTVRGYSAPAGLPDNVQKKLDSAFKAAITDPDVVKAMKNLGLETTYEDAAGYAKVWKEQDKLFRSVLDLVLEAE